MELKKSKLLLSLVIAGGVFCSTASFAAEEKEKVGGAIPTPQELADKLKTLIVKKIGSKSAADLCAQGTGLSPLTFRSFEGVPCCNTYSPIIGPDFKLPSAVCRPFAALAQAVCGASLNGTKCGKGVPDDIKANPATEITAAIKKDPSGFVAEIVCSDASDLPEGSALAKISKTPGVCDEAKAMRKKH